MNKLKVAFIGAGWVCRQRHIPIFAQHCETQCFGVVDASPQTAAAGAQCYQMPHFSAETDPGAIPWLSECDAVCITTPPQHHYEWIMWALENQKHILTEKPITISREKGRTIFEKARQTKKIFCVNHNTLFTNAATKARQALATGQFGPVTDYAINLYNSPRRHLPAWYDQLPFGLLYDELSHFLYQADSICPELRVYSAQVFPSRTGMQTPASARITLLSKCCPVFFSMHFESPLCEWHIIIAARQGLIVLDIFRDIFIFLPNDGQHKALDQLRTIRRGISGYIRGFVKSGLKHIQGKLYFGTDRVIQHFLASCHGEAPLPDAINAASGARIYNLLCDCVEALQADTGLKPPASGQAGAMAGR